MLDKIRLHAVGRLPAECVANLGDGLINALDGRCCRFPGVRDSGLTGKPTETIIDHIEYDERRDPVATKAWDPV